MAKPPHQHYDVEDPAPRKVHDQFDWTATSATQRAGEMSLNLRRTSCTARVQKGPDHKIITTAPGATGKTPFAWWGCRKSIHDVLSRRFRRCNVNRHGLFAIMWVLDGFGLVNHFPMLYAHLHT